MFRVQEDKKEPAKEDRRQAARKEENLRRDWCLGVKNSKKVKMFQGEEVVNCVKRG